MASTVTLATTTLTNRVDAKDNELVLASYSGIYPGLRLFIDKELMNVESVRPDSRGVRVRRGHGGTAAVPHSSSAVVTIGTADQFYMTDPVGAPGESTPVAPYINVLNGKVFYAQGDAQPTGLTFRWWQEVTTTYSTGPFGVRVSESSPSSST